MASHTPNPDPGRRPLPFKQAGGGRLESWKEIAAYFRRDIRTVQRWERTEGLPVHRHTHEKGGTVYALRPELDAWWSARCAEVAAEPLPEVPEQGGWQAKAPAPRKFPWVAAAICACLIALAAVAAWRYLPAHDHRPIASASALTPVPGRLLANATAEGHAIRWIPVGKAPRAAVVSSDGSRVYVSNRDSGTVSVVRTSDESVAGTISVGGRPLSLTITPDGRWLYVGNQSGYVSEVDLTSNSARSIAAGGPVSDVTVVPDGKRAYFAAGFHGLYAFDVPGGRPEPISTSAAPMYLAALSDGSRLYINYQGGGPGGRPGHDAIDELDLFSRRVMKAIAGPPNVGGPISVSPDGSQIWADGEDACSAPAYDHIGCPGHVGGMINVLRPSDDRLLSTFGFPEEGELNVTFFPDGSRAAIAGIHLLRVVDTARFATLESLDAGIAGKLAFSVDGRHAYCPVQDRNAVAVFDMAADACAQAPTGLLASWTGDGAGAGMVQPEIGKAAFAPGLVGQAFLLDGSKPLAIKAPDYGAGPDEMTITAWVKVLPSESPRETAYLELTDRRASGWRVLRNREGYLRLCAIDDRRQDGCIDSESAVGHVALAPGTWAHIAVLRTAKEVSLYLNGAPEASISASRLPAADGVTLRLGLAGRSTDPLRGLADEIYWFNRALAPAEIRRIVTAGASGLCYSRLTAGS